MFITLCIIFSFVYALVTTAKVLWNSILFAFAGSGGGWTNLGEILYQNVTKPSAVIAISTLTHFYGDLEPNLDSVPAPLIIIFGVTELVIGLIDSCFWVFISCALFLWARLFGKLFEIFLCKVKTCNYLESNILQVRLFEKNHNQTGLFYDCSLYY